MSQPAPKPDKYRKWSALSWKSGCIPQRISTGTFSLDVATGKLPLLCNWQGGTPPIAEEKASTFGCHPLCFAHDIFGIEYVPWTSVETAGIVNFQIFFYWKPHFLAGNLSCQQKIHDLSLAQTEVDVPHCTFCVLDVLDVDWLGSFPSELLSTSKHVIWGGATGESLGATGEQKCGNFYLGRPQCFVV